MGYLKGRKVKYIDVNPDTKFNGFIDDETTFWKESRLGIIPRRCDLTNKMLWPFTKVGTRILMHVSDKALYSKRFWCSLDEVPFANLKIVR